MSPPRAHSSTSEQVVMTPQAPIVDARGQIHNLVEASFGSALRIVSVKGSTRANHYHKTDFHYCWLQRGGLIYAQRRVGDGKPPQQWVIKPGQLFYTPPRYEHVMYFTEDSEMFCFARNNRNMAEYEEDTVRIAPLTLAVAA